MAILSFAHLKKSPPGIPENHHQVVPVSRDTLPIKKTGQVMSFAYLKTSGNTVDHEPMIRLQRLSGIGIMKTALLVAVNYCEGCPRFWPSNDQEKAMGVPYGRCMRKEDEEYEYWRSIPLSARVSRCWWHQQGEIDRNTCGPHPETTIGKEWSINLRSEL